MRAIGLLLLLILLIAAVFFSMANRETVEIGFWPLDVAKPMPLFLPVFVALVVGFFAGWIGSWVHEGRARKQLREAMRQNRDDAVQIDRLKRDLKEAQSGQATVPQIAA